MNTNTAIAALLDSSRPVEGREELFLSLLYSDAPDLDRPLLVSSIIKSKVEDGFLETVIASSPSAPSPETVALLRSFVDNPAETSVSCISLISLTKIERLKAIPVLRSVLAGDNKDLRDIAIVALQHLPIDVNSNMYREVICYPSFSPQNHLVAAFALAQQGDDCGREVLRNALQSDSCSGIRQVTALCGLAYLKDIDGIRQLIAFLRFIQKVIPGSERDIDRRYRLVALKHLCGFKYEGMIRDCTAEAIEHLERLLLA